ncbi:GNAT family N-acetyltransferase [Streptomyces olivaceoviridis]
MSKSNFAGRNAAALEPSVSSHFTGPPPAPPRFRPAGSGDADAIARLQVSNWRRHYRGAFSDTFLDGDLVAEWRTAWTSRLSTPGGTATVLAEDDAGLAGLVHVVFDEDGRWGSLIDGLHVSPRRRRTGLGTELLSRAAKAVAERARGGALYLWVLEQNTAAQEFYLALGGTCAERAAVAAPGGVPSRLTGSPSKLRFTWPDATVLARLEARRGQPNPL